MHDWSFEFEDCPIADDWNWEPDLSVANLLTIYQHSGLYFGSNFKKTLGGGQTSSTI